MKGPKSTAQDLSWARLLRLKLDLNGLATWAKDRQRANTGDGWYIGALVDLQQGHPADASQKLTRMGGVWYGDDSTNWRDQVQAMVSIASAQPVQGLKALQNLARRADQEPKTCRWGQGSYFDDQWGEAALKQGRLDDAQEAFSEGLAHEHGSIVSALGLQVVWERRHKAAMAKQFADRAHDIWSEADPGAAQALLVRLRSIADGKAEPF
jgi:hypothetical protein